MKHLLFTMLLATTVAFAQDGAAKKGPSSKAHVLTKSEIDDLLTKPDQVLIVDVRRPDEIKEIGGFPVYLNVQIAELERSLPWIPKDRTIIAVSNHAARAGRAADILAKNGFNVAGAAGAETYEQEGGKLTKIVAPPPNNNAKKASVQ